MENNGMKSIGILVTILLICIVVLGIVLYSKKSSAKNNIPTSTDDILTTNEQNINSAEENIAETVPAEPALTQEEAKKIVEGQWKELEKLFSKESYFEESTKKEKILGTVQYYNITNYEEVMAKYFTVKGKSLFENTSKSSIGYIFIDGKLYKLENKKNNLYIDLKEISDVKIEENKITGSLILDTYSDTTKKKKIEKKTEFVVEKNAEGVWLIDEFDLKDLS